MVEKRTSKRIVTGLGMPSLCCFFLMKVLARIPRAFFAVQMECLGIWVLLGAILYRRKALELNPRND